MSESNYAWAANPAKLKQAIIAAGPDASEEVVRSEYEKRGGLLSNINSNNMSESTEEAKVEETTAAAPESTEAAPEASAPAAEASSAPADASSPAPEATPEAVI